MRAGVQRKPPVAGEPLPRERCEWHRAPHGAGVAGERGLQERAVGRRVCGVEQGGACARPDVIAIRHLQWLADQIGDDLLDAAVITTRTRSGAPTASR
jgi:hypothetical protein